MRALERGYISCRRSGFCHVEVARDIAPRLRVISKSLTLHNEHNQRAGYASHYARRATTAAQLAPESSKLALALHRAANRAKHEWSVSQTSATSSDPLWTLDPWVNTGAAAGNQLSSSLSSSPLVVLPAAGSAGRVKNMVKLFERSESCLLDAPLHSKEVSSIGLICDDDAAPVALVPPPACATPEQTALIQQCVIEQLGGFLAQLAASQQAQRLAAESSYTELLMTTASALSASVTTLSNSMHTLHDQALAQVAALAVEIKSPDSRIQKLEESVASTAQLPQMTWDAYQKSFEASTRLDDFGTQLSEAQTQIRKLRSQVEELFQMEYQQPVQTFGPAPPESSPLEPDVD